MAKYENIRALAKKQLQAVTESSDRWKAFLRTAAIAYNYSFPNQLLIHEQSPTATAVADIAYASSTFLPSSPSGSTIFSQTLTDETRLNA